MIDFPTSTTVNRRLSKDSFYKHLPLTKSLKDKFVSDVDRVTVENSLTKDNLNLIIESKIKEILLLSVTLKIREFDGKVIEEIAKHNSHKLVFLLIFNDSCQLALYYGKLYRTKWVDASEVSLKLQGFSLDEIWDSFIEQIALNEEQAVKSNLLSVDERLALQDKIQKLEILVKKTESAVIKEKQTRKKFELYEQLLEYKKKLEDLKNGD